MKKLAIFLTVIFIFTILYIIGDFAVTTKVTTLTIKSIMESGKKYMDLSKYVVVTETTKSSKNINIFEDKKLIQIEIKVTKDIKVTNVYEMEEKKELSEVIFKGKLYYKTTILNANNHKPKNGWYESALELPSYDLNTAILTVKSSNMYTIRFPNQFDIYTYKKIGDIYQLVKDEYTNTDRVFLFSYSKPNYPSFLTAKNLNWNSYNSAINKKEIDANLKKLSS